MASRVLPEEKEKIYKVYREQGRNISATARILARNPKTTKKIVEEMEAENSKSSPPLKDDPDRDLLIDYIRGRRTGKTPSESMIKLKLTTEEQRRFEKEYQDLKKMDLRDKTERSRAKMRRLARELGKVQNDLELTRGIVQKTKSENHKLLDDQERLKKTLADLQLALNEKFAQKKSLDAALEQNKRKLSVLNEENIHDQSAHYTKLLIQNSKALEELRKWMEDYDKRTPRKFETTLGCLIQALHVSPQKDQFMMDVFYGSGPIGAEYSDLIAKKYLPLLGLAEYFHNLALAEVTSNTRPEGAITTDSKEQPIIAPRPKIQVPLGSENSYKQSLEPINPQVSKPSLIFPFAFESLAIQKFFLEDDANLDRDYVNQYSSGFVPTNSIPSNGPEIEGCSEGAGVCRLHLKKPT
jgi:hypothetical protein